MRIDATYDGRLVQYDLQGVFLGQAAHKAGSLQAELQELLNDGWEPFAVSNGSMWLKRRTRYPGWDGVQDDPA